MKRFLVLGCLAGLAASAAAQENQLDVISQDFQDDAGSGLPADLEAEPGLGEASLSAPEESVDERGLGKRGGEPVAVPLVKKAPPKKVVYRAAPKKAAPILRPAPKQIASVTYIPTPTKKSVPRKLQEVDEEITGEPDASEHEIEEMAGHHDLNSDEGLAELSSEENEQAETEPEESTEDRELGGNKKNSAPVPVKLPQPKKVAAPVYLGKKGGFYGGGFYRRLSEEDSDALEQEAELLDNESESVEELPEESTDERNLGKRNSGSYLPVEKKAPPPKKVAVAAPKKVIRAAPKKVVRAAPKKVIRAAPKKVIRSPPKEVIRSAPKKVISAPTKKGAGYYRRLQEADQPEEDALVLESEDSHEEESDQPEEALLILEDQQSHEEEPDQRDEDALVLEGEQSHEEESDESASDRFLGGKKRDGGMPIPLPLPKKLPAPKKIVTSKPIVYLYSKKL